MPESSAFPGSEERIGAYRIEKLLGRGGMGEVFLAWDDRLRRRVAIKRIRHDRSLEPALRKRLLREARAAAGLNHPAIVQIHDLVEEVSGDCLVLEYVEGKTLAATLKEGSLEMALAMRLGREIAGGLAAAHAAGIVHRDLKPDNVIVTPSGHAKVLDFGLARMRSSTTGDMVLTQHGILLGTFHMMSPEQARGDEADERSDLFSFGTLLYEMLTGISPFRGSHPLETLNKVISETPPRVNQLRPWIPPRLTALIERLLAKEPADRPASAAEVEQELEAITATPSTPSGESVSDLPTIVELRPDEVTLAFPRSPMAPAASTAGMSVLSRRRHLREIALAASLVALAAASYVLYRQPGEPEQAVKPAPAKPLRVVVPKPQIDGDDERLSLAASGVLTASLNALGALEGVAAVDPLQLAGGPKTPVEMARSAAADEVVVSKIEKAGNLGRITLRRIRGLDGTVLWADNFDAPIEAEDLRLLANAVSIHLSRGYPGQRQRAGTFTPEVRDEDYATFLKIKQRTEAGSVPSAVDLAILEEIAGRSPRFLQARLLAADLLLNRFQSTKDAAYYDRALRFVQEARTLAPEDPEPLLRQLNIELAGDQPRVAAATLARLENLLPGDPGVLIPKSKLAERDGRMEEALSDLETAAARLPSWQNLTLLADLEARTGHVEDARGHLQQILQGSPENAWALNKLAKIELLYGSLERAEQIYEGLIARAPHRAYLNNLGLIRIFLGHYEDAIEAFRQALELDPDHTDVTLNLAEAELALGRRKEAEGHFRKVLAEMEKNRPPGGLSAADSMVQAQCLAQLGRTREAVEITLKALRQNPEDGEVLQGAALVYALVGDRASAMVNVQSALQKGVQPRWFTLPAFASLLKDPEFRELLWRAPGAPSSL